MTIQPPNISNTNNLKHVCTPGCQLIFHSPVQCIMLPSYTSELLLLFSGPQRSQGIMQHGACKLYLPCWSRLGKSVEKGMAELFPCLLLTGQMNPSLLEDPQQHHRQPHHHFNHCHCPRKHFHLSHPTLLFPLCWYKSCSAQRSGCGSSDTLKECNKRQTRGQFPSGSVPGLDLGSAGPLPFSFSPAQKKGRTFSASSTCSNREAKHTKSESCNKLCRARALHKYTKENPDNSKDKEKLNWVQLDISHSFPTIVLTSIEAAHTESYGHLPQPAASW